MKKYQISGWTKFGEEDIFTKGCLPNTTFESVGTDVFRDDTKEGAIKAFAFFCGVDDDDAIQKNACDEVGRIDISVMEAADGMSVSQSDIESWQGGKMRLWNCIYTGYLEQVERVNA